MDHPTSRLILICYAAIALIVGTTTFMFYRMQTRAVPPAMVLEGSRELPRPVQTGVLSQARSNQLRLDIERQRDRIRELQLLLNKRERILQQQAAQLATTREKSQRLQDEADRYLQLLQTLMQESAASTDQNLAMLEDVGANQLDSSGQPIGNVESLEATLTAAEWELIQSMEAAALLQAQLDLQMQQRTALQQALLDAGDMAVPLLIDLLSKGDAELKTWAASALGRTRSPLAMDALIVAAEQGEVAVRNAALAAIEELNRE